MNAPDAGAGVDHGPDPGAGHDPPHRTQLRQLADEQAALRRVATLVAGGARPAEVFTAVADELGRLIGAEATFVSRLDHPSGKGTEPEGYVTVVGSYGWVSDQVSVGFRTKLLPETIQAAVLRTGRPARVNGVQLTNGPYGEWLGGLGLRAGVASPIVVGGRYWGVVAAVTSQPDFPAGTESRMADFMELAATAIANAQAEEQTRKLADTQAALRRLATLIARGESPEEVFTAATREALRYFGGGIARMIRYEFDGAATLVASAGSTDPDERAGGPWEGNVPAGLTATVRRTGQAARVDDYLNVPGREHFVREGLRSAVGTPILVNGRLWGFIAVGSGEGPLPDGTEQRMTEFTDLVATAVANAQNRAALETSRDELARLLAEQAALRRVATLVARGIDPVEIFSAVAEEAGRLLQVGQTNMIHYESDATSTVVASWRRTGKAIPSVGDRQPLGEKNLTTLISQTRRPARIDSYADASGGPAVAAREAGFRSAAGGAGHRPWPSLGRHDRLLGR